MSWPRGRTTGTKTHGKPANALRRPGSAAYSPGLMTRASRLALLSLILPAQLAAQDSAECIGYDLKDPGERIQMLAPTHTWTLYNLGPGAIIIRASTGDDIPGPRPSSEPVPTEFRGQTGTSYTLSLDGPGLTIVYICPGI